MADYYNNGLVLEQANELAALRAQLAEAQAERDEEKLAYYNLHEQYVELCRVVAYDRQTIASQRAWIEDAGHTAGCRSGACEVCGKPVLSGWYEHDSERADRLGGVYHECVAEPCSCGYAKLVGG